MRNYKKYLAAAMSAAMVACLSVVPAQAEGGKVYYLNFKPEADQACQDLAATYTEQTGV